MVEDDPCLVLTAVTRCFILQDGGARSPLKRTANRGVSLKVSEKGGLSVYGLGRFPVTLYKEQWTKLLDIADDIRAFIRSTEASLTTKS